MGNCPYTSEELRKELVKLRLGAERYIGKIFKLTELMGCENASDKVKISYLIALIRYVFTDPQEVNALSVAFNLHPKYKNAKGVIARRKESYKDYWDKLTDSEKALRKKLTKPESTLQKREDELIKAIVDRVRKTADLPTILKKAVAERERKKNPPPNPNDELLTMIKDIISSSSNPTKEEPATKKRHFPFHNKDLPARNEGFRWRKKQLWKIHKQFLRNNKIAVLAFGLGGIGKTQIALEYAYIWGYRRKHRNGVVLWINAEEFSTTMEAIEEFVTYKQIAKREDGDKAMHNAFLDWFECSGNWLMVFDNAKGYKEIAPFLPKHRSETGHILVTTQIKDGWGVDPIDVDVFSEDEAKWFLLKRTNSVDEHGQVSSKDAQGAGKLAERLGCFPLALEQAGAYIALWKKDEGVSFTQYLSWLEERGIKLIKPVSEAEYKSSVVATFEISIKKIKDSEAALQLLYLCAYFAPNDIDISLFTSRPNCLPNALRKEIADKYSRLEVIKQLTQYSLVKYHDQKISIHRLMQEVIREEIEKNGDVSYISTCLKLVTNTINAIFQLKNGHYNNSDSEIEDVVRRRISHASTVAKYAESILTRNDSYAYTLVGAVRSDIGNAYITLKNHNEPVGEYQKAILKNKFREAASSYQFIAETYEKKGNYNVALKWYKMILTLIEKHDNYFSCNRYLQLENKFCKRSIEENAEFEELRGSISNPEYVSRIYCYIGNIYYLRKEDYHEALDWYRRALLICTLDGQYNELTNAIHDCEEKLNNAK